MERRAELPAHTPMACVEMEGRSIPLDDATVRTHDHAVPGRVNDINLSSDTEPRRDTLLEHAHENVGPRAHDRSNSHVSGGVPLPRGSGATTSENAGPRAHDRSKMGRPESVQHSCKDSCVGETPDAKRKPTCKSIHHLRKGLLGATPRSCDYDPEGRVPSGESSTGIVSEYGTSGLRDDAAALPAHVALPRSTPRSTIRNFLRTGAQQHVHAHAHTHAHQSKSQRAMHNHTDETVLHTVSRELQHPQVLHLRYEGSDLPRKRNPCDD